MPNWAKRPCVGRQLTLNFGRRLLNRRAAPFGTFPALFVTGVVLVRAGSLGVATKKRLQ